MSTRNLLLAVLVVVGVAGAPAVARAEGFGLGIFLGQPTGLDLKIDLARRSALDIVLGFSRLDDDSAHYAHVTYLVTPFAANGRSVVVPFRLGVGGVFYDGAGDFGDEINIGVRAPLQIGLMFRRAPFEIYGEIAIKITFVDDNDNNDDVDADGGVGFRFYF